MGGGLYPRRHPEISKSAGSQRRYPRPAAPSRRFEGIAQPQPFAVLMIDHRPFSRSPRRAARASSSICAYAQTLHHRKSAHCNGALHRLPGPSHNASTFAITLCPLHLQVFQPPRRPYVVRHPIMQAGNKNAPSAASSLPRARKSIVSRRHWRSRRTTATLPRIGIINTAASFPSPQPPPENSCRVKLCVVLEKASPSSERCPDQPRPYRQAPSCAPL